MFPRNKEECALLQKSIGEILQPLYEEHKVLTAKIKELEAQYSLLNILTSLNEVDTNGRK